MGCNLILVLLLSLTVCPEGAGDAFIGVVGAGEVERADIGHTGNDFVFESLEIFRGNLESFAVELAFGVWLNKMQFCLYYLKWERAVEVA